MITRSIPPDKETLTQPPFITSSWIKKAINEPIECIIAYKV